MLCTTSTPLKLTVVDFNRREHVVYDRSSLSFYSCSIPLGVSIFFHFLNIGLVDLVSFPRYSAFSRRRRFEDSQVSPTPCIIPFWISIGSTLSRRNWWRSSFALSRQKQHAKGRCYRHHLSPRCQTRRPYSKGMKMENSVSEKRPFNPRLHSLQWFGK